MSRAYLSTLLLLILLFGAVVVHGWAPPQHNLSAQIVAVSGRPGVAFSGPYLGTPMAPGLPPSGMVHPGLEPPDYTGFVYVH